MVTVNGREVDYSTLPSHMVEGARGYLERGYEPGSFLRSVLENDLVGAFAHADLDNQGAMFAWAAWLYNECPSPAWGSPGKVRAWIAAFAPGGAS